MRSGLGLGLGLVWCGPIWVWVWSDLRPGLGLGLAAQARELFERLQARHSVFYDASGAIGRRYRRMDEVGAHGTARNCCISFILYSCMFCVIVVSFLRLQFDFSLY